VIIASPVRLVREGLMANLRGRKRVAVVAAVDLSPQGVARIAETKADVVLVDVSQAEAASLARLIKSVSPQVKLVAFALDENIDQVLSCAAASFSGYIPREGSAEEVFRAIVDVMEGRMHCAPHIAAAMFGRLAGFLRLFGQQKSLPPLTFRENEILELVEQGFSNKEIARRLAISSSTVKNHMHSILQKLQVSRRAQAVARLHASRNG
jgi:DNA-binding NarL/FixJ family response regulator